MAWEAKESADRQEEAVAAFERSEPYSDHDYDDDTAECYAFGAAELDSVQPSQKPNCFHCLRCGEDVRYRSFPQHMTHAHSLDPAAVRTWLSVQDGEEFRLRGSCEERFQFAWDTWVPPEWQDEIKVDAHFADAQQDTESIKDL